MEKGFRTCLANTLQRLELDRQAVTVPTRDKAGAHENENKTRQVASQHGKYLTF
jgi:hypothetical protein